MGDAAHVCLEQVHPWLGGIPGPLAIAVTGDTIWAVGGGRGESNILRYDARGWRRIKCDANGLRAVVAVSTTEAIVVGERGYIARVTADGGPVLIETDSTECLFSLAPRADGTLFVFGDAGVAYTVNGDTATRLRLRPVARLARATADSDEGGPVATALGLAHVTASGGFDLRLTSPAPLTAIAKAPDGTLGVTGDRGQLYLVRDGAEPRRIELGSEAANIDVDAIAWDPGREMFVVGTSSGRLLTLALGGAVTELTTVPPPERGAARRVSSIVPWRAGLLVGAWAQIGPPYQFRGVIAYVGDPANAPTEVVEPARYPVPPRRERTVGLAIAGFLGAGDGQILGYDDARQRIPEVSWPETQLEHVRFFDGDVRVRDTKELFAATDAHRNYAVAIKGALIVDGPLNAVAGGDGYDSMLVVGGDVWCEGAVLRYGIKASIGGTLECATVVLCSHGDDGGTLWAKKIRAQLLAYSCYFPRPDADMECVTVGSVYGEPGDLPEGRANEVFRAEFLDGERFDERELQGAILEGRPLLLD